MKLYRFDREVGRPIERFGSQGLAISPVLRHAGALQIGCMHVAEGGLVGYHQATVKQLFLVVQGHGWVRGEGVERVHIQAGQAAFWEAGEFHEAGTEQGMTALVVEGEELDPAALMREVQG